MQFKFPAGRFALAALASIAASGVLAAPTVYSGEDLDANFTVPPAGASVSAKDSFLSKLMAGSTLSEGFSQYTPLQAGPLTKLWGGANSLDAGTTDSNIARIENRQSMLSTSPGRFNTTPTGTDCATAPDESCNWWQSKQTFTLDFDPQRKVSAFGFFGTDFADFGGSLDLELWSGGVQYDTLSALMAPSPPPGAAPPANPNGSLMFFGFTDAERGYDRIVFRITQTSGSDVLGFDDLVIGDLAPSTGVPEPATLALVGLSLVGMAATRRRPRR